MKRLLLVTLLAAPALTHADEGMWTFNDFPKAAVEKAYGFKVSDAWLDHLRLSSVRLAQGCSASFVSERGLILTNHHCARGCIEQLSGPGKDYVADGFLAKTPGDELKCPALEVNQLVRIEDVTARLGKATEGLEGKAFNDAQRAEVKARFPAVEEVFLESENQKLHAWHVKAAPGAPLVLYFGGNAEDVNFS